MLQRPSLPSYQAIPCPAHTGISAWRCSLPGRSNQTQWETRTSTRVCVHPDTRTFVQVGGQARTAWARSSRQRGLRAGAGPRPYRAGLALAAALAAAAMAAGFSAWADAEASEAELLGCGTPSFLRSAFPHF